MTTVALVGSLDTKGEEYAFARDRLAQLGVTPLVIDTGTMGDPGFVPDIGAAEVARAGGADLDALREAHDRAAAIEAMGRGAAAVLGRLVDTGDVDGVWALGGSGGTTMASTAFARLPLGFPKLILSTMASGDVRGYVGHSDLVLAASVVDIAGLNRISRTVIANAAAAIAGMAAAPPLPSVATAGGDLVALSMIGLTTRAVTAARARLEALGYEVVVFHMTGAGGATMESLIEQGQVAGVVDLTTSELANELGGGICSAGPGRLGAAARHGVPQVVAPGGMDMINFGPLDTVPERYRGRTIHAHNREITLVRTDAVECAELGRRLVDRVSGAGFPAAPGEPRSVVLVPSGGLSAIDVAGDPWFDPVADDALRAAVRAAVQDRAGAGRLRLVEVDGDIDRPEVGHLAAELLHDLILAQTGGSRCTP